MADNKVNDKGKEVEPIVEEKSSLCLLDLMPSNKPGANDKGQEKSPAKEQAPDGHLDVTNPYENNQGARAAAVLQKLFDNVLVDPAAKEKAIGVKAEDYKDGKGVTRILGDGVGQHVAADGTTTTHLSHDSTLEYNPKTQAYTTVDANGKRTPVTDKDARMEQLGGKSINELNKEGIGAPQKVEENGNEGFRKTYPDGRVETTFDKGAVEKRVTFPPGYKKDDAAADAPPDGLRQQIDYRAKGDGSATPCTVKKYDDRNETTFVNGPIDKITAFKGSAADKPDVITEYKPAGEGKFSGPDGAKSIATYKDGNPDQIASVASYGDGKGDKVTYKNGFTTERSNDLDVLRTGIGSGENAGVLDVNAKSGMPTRMKVGDRDFSVGYDASGKPEKMSVSANGDKKGTLDYNMKTGEISGTGKYAPNEKGEIDFNGMILKVKPNEVDKDGKPVPEKGYKIEGELSLNKAGDLLYKNGTGPERTEVVQRANGTKEEYDFKNWKQTITGADGKKQDAYWNGFEWDKTGKPSEDGKRINFEPTDKSKPTFIERDASNNPSKDITKIGYGDGHTVECDWKNGVQVEKTLNPPSETTRYYDGATYREGQKIDAKDPLYAKLGMKEGDSAVRFKDGDPVAAIRHSDGSMTIRYTNATVEKDKNNHVTETNGPNGHYKYGYDADGDLNKVTHSTIGADGKEVESTITRTGREQDPGMQRWLEREANGKPHAPGDLAPRDPNAPKGYNTWVDEKGQPVKDASGKPLGPMNFHVTADGAQVQEKPALDGKTSEKTVLPPGEGVYKETANTIEKSLPGAVTQVTDKTQNPPTTSLKFTRNGIDYTASGNATVTDDGTVIEPVMGKSDAKDGPAQVLTGAKYNLPDGSLASSSIGADKKETFTELKIAKAGAKEDAYESIKPGVNGVKSIERDPQTGAFKVTNDDKSVTTIDTYRGTRAVQKAGENFATVKTPDGSKVLGLLDGNGHAMLRFNDNGSVEAMGIKNKSFDSKKWNFDQITTNAAGNPVVKERNGNGTLELQRRGVVSETRDNKTTTTYASGVETTSEGGKVSAVKVGDKSYTPNLDKDGNIISLKPQSGAELKPFGGGAFKINEDGQFVSDRTDPATGVRTLKGWDAASGAVQVVNQWKNAQDQVVSSGFIADKDGKVLTYKLPDGGRVENKGEARLENGNLVVDSKDSSTQVKPDGSTEITAKGSGEKRQLDRNQNLVPTEQQADAVPKAVEKLLQDPSNQEAIKSFLSGLANSKDPMKDAQSFFKALDSKLAGAAISVAASGNNAFKITITKNGKSVSIPWTPTA